MCLNAAQIIRIMRNQCPSSHRARTRVIPHYYLGSAVEVTSAGVQALARTIDLTVCTVRLEDDKAEKVTKGYMSVLND